MKSLFLIFNHEITGVQRQDANASLGVERIVNLPEHLKAAWRQIPPDDDDIEESIAPVVEWLKTAARPGDFVLIQGDFGAVYKLVKVAFDNELIPVYSTTIRQAKERLGDDGSVELTHCFRHVRFRRYIP